MHLFATMEMIVYEECAQLEVLYFAVALVLKAVIFNCCLGFELQFYKANCA